MNEKRIMFHLLKHTRKYVFPKKKKSLRCPFCNRKMAAHYDYSSSY